MNLYWPIYLNLEKELIDLSNKIHIDDRQLDVYSPAIADIIVRCAVEVEAISKEMYLKINDENIKEPHELYFDTDCLEYLNNIWDTCSKELTIKAINFYLSDNNKLLKPLHKSNKRGTSSAKWLMAYQGLKHDRKNSLKKGTIKNAINALGGLYILNIYYKYFKNPVPKDISVVELTESKIFGVSIYNATNVGTSGEINDTLLHKKHDRIKAIFIYKYTDSTLKRLEKASKADGKIIYDRLVKLPEYVNWKKDNPDVQYDSINQLCNVIGGNELFSKVLYGGNTREAYNIMRNEYVININQIIYR